MIRIAVLIALALAGCNTQSHRQPPLESPQCAGPCDRDCRCVDYRDCPARCETTRPYPLPIEWSDTESEPKVDP